MSLTLIYVGRKLRNLRLLWPLSSFVPSTFQFSIFTSLYVLDWWTFPVSTIVLIVFVGNVVSVDFQNSLIRRHVSLFVKQSYLDSTVWILVPDDSRSDNLAGLFYSLSETLMDFYSYSYTNFRKSHNSFSLAD